MPDLTLTIPLPESGSFFDTLSWVRPASTLSDLSESLQPISGILSPYCTGYILFRSPIFRDNRIPLLSFLCVRTKENFTLSLFNISAFETPAKAVMAMQWAPSYPPAFWLQVREPFLYEAINKCQILSLPNLLKPQTFPRSSAKTAGTSTRAGLRQR